MISEEHEILRSTIREFVTKNIEPEALEIERNGISSALRKSIAAQGFLGAVVKPELGGSGLDEKGYLILLDELARASPSVAADVMLLNSFFYPLASLSEDGEKAVGEILAAGTGVTVGLNPVLEGYREKHDISDSSGKLDGNEHNLPNRNAASGILLTKDGKLVLVNNSDSFTGKEYSFGFRGLGLTDVKLNGAQAVTLKDKDGEEEISAALDRADLSVSAVALGIVSGCLAKAIDYSRVRKTFGQSLSDYQPVAFTISSLKGEEEILRRSLYADDLDERSRLMLKIKALELAKRASKYALQVHGGYGYFEDFGVEKFYRDSTALASLFARSVKDHERLSEYVYENKAGFL